MDPNAIYVNQSLHTWAEIYVPITDEKGAWVLCDPAIGFKMKYPEANEGAWYRTGCLFPELMNPKARSLKIKVGREVIKSPEELLLEHAMAGVDSSRAI